MLYALLVAVLVAADQLVKFQVRAHIPLYGSRTLIPHFVGLTYVRNTGAAFSLFSEHTWILALISAVVSVAIIIVLAKGIVDTPVGRLCLSVVLAGTIGNLIDRAFIGYVTDMFDFLFMRFAVFNVADICVVCGGIATCIYLLFFYTKWEKI
ncbi:Lipoprotein signal peptidase [bioreactor metagenome]|uniref:Lipoprotein signal peptidase n=1 Tax=bioreactor metagenome TaxID=1076179 RepID=A0A644Y9Q6_9ZZZZ